MKIGFNFELLWKDEDVLQVRIRASNGNFSGMADTYVPIGGLAAAASQLEGFPRDPADRRHVQFGVFGPEYAGGAVKMRFYCKGGAGSAHVETEIESDQYGSRPPETARFFSRVEANAVDLFVLDLRRLENEHGTAELALLAIP